MNKDMYLFLEYISLLDFNARDYRVLLSILEKVSGGVYVKINQRKICEDLGMSKSEASKAIKVLTEQGILVKDTNLEKKGKNISLKLKDFTKDVLDDLIFEIINKREDQE